MGYIGKEFVVINDGRTKETKILKDENMGNGYSDNKSYMELANDLLYNCNEQRFSLFDKVEMLFNIFSIIKKKDFISLHELMDYISKMRKKNLFNFLVFDAKAKDNVLAYINCRVAEKNGSVGALKRLERSYSSTDDLVSNDVPLQRNCTTCEDYHGICMGNGVKRDDNKSTFGMPLEDALRMFPNGCEAYHISLEAYMILCERRLLE